jgi:hypothetical protein
MLALLTLSVVESGVAPPPSPVDALLTEAGDDLETEAGETLEVE